MNAAPLLPKHPRYRVRADVDVLESDASLRRLPLENISLGGMFIKTLAAPAPGSPIRVRLFDAEGDATLGVTARVVHVIDEPTSLLKHHPAGMGVQYLDVAPHTATMLRGFVERLAASAQAEPVRTSSARFITAQVVEVDASRPALRALWELSLKLGGLFAEGIAPALGSTVEVRIGGLRLCADIVHVQPGVGAGLQLVDPTGAGRASVLRYLAGETDRLGGPAPPLRGPPLHKVLALVRQLFAGLEAADGFAALALPMSADEDDVRRRVASVRRILSAEHTDATPPQSARIDAALRALARLEPALLARVVALRNEAELVPRPATTSAEQARRRDLLDAAASASARGDQHLARGHLARALELCPNDVEVKQRLVQAQQAIETARALEAVSQAEVFVKGLGMKEEAARLARVALEASPVREIRLRALGVLARAGSLDEAITVGEGLLAADESDPLALQMLMHLYERTKERVRAARTGERLLRLRPHDAELQKTVRRLIKAARV